MCCATCQGLWSCCHLWRCADHCLLCVPTLPCIAACRKIGLSLGWVYLFMGVVVGSAVPPIAFCITWRKISAAGAIVGAVGGLVGAIITWICVAKVRGQGVVAHSLLRLQNEPWRLPALHAAEPRPHPAQVCVATALQRGLLWAPRCLGRLGVQRLGPKGVCARAAMGRGLHKPCSQAMSTHASHTQVMPGC